MDAVNAAYRVVVPRDAVAGIPSATTPTRSSTTRLSLLATITTTDELIEAWGRT